MAGDVPSHTPSPAYDRDSSEADKMVLDLPLRDKSASAPPLEISSSPEASVGPITLKVFMAGKDKKFEVSFLSLHSGIFFDTIRSILSIPSGEPFTIRRWSDSGATWMVLNPQDQDTWKQMLRAAKAKLKLRLRVDIIRTTHGESDTPKGAQGDQLSHDTAGRPPPYTQSGDYFSQDPSQARPLVSVKLRFQNKLRKFTVPMDDVFDPHTLFTSLCTAMDVKSPEGLVFERFSDSADAYTAVGPVATSHEYRQLVRAAKAKMKLRMRARFADDPLAASVPPLAFLPEIKREYGHWAPPASPV